jgi:hypothetical protein
MHLVGYVYEDYHAARSLEHKVLFEVQKFPTFQGNRYVKVVRLSDLGTGYLYPQVIFLVLISFRG